MFLKVFILSFLSFILSGALKVRILNTYPDLKTVEYKITSDLGASNNGIMGLYSNKYISIDAQNFLIMNVFSTNFNLSLTDQDEIDACSIFIIVDLNNVITIRLKYDNLKEIKMADQARWSIISISENLSNLTIYTQNSICYKCAFIKTGELAYGSDLSNLENNTIHGFQLKIENSNGFSKTLTLDIEQNGIYTYILTDLPNNDISLIKITETEPKNTWAPLLVFFSILIFICIARLVVYYLIEKRKNLKQFDENSLLEKGVLSELRTNPQNPSGKRPERSRVESLDTFRGMSLAIMIFVNYEGGNYWFFQHSDWNGLTFADLVFPWFIWIMGTSMALSFDKLAKNKTNHFDYIYKIFRRSVLLFLIGLILINNGYDLGAWRIPGVLQRFAICYLVIALIVSYVPLLKSHPLSIFRDIVPFLYQWITVILILVLYIILTYVPQFENCPRGYTGAGGLADNGEYPNCTGGSALFIDKAIFGNDRIFHEPTAQRFYKSETFDPEGLLGSLTSVVLTFTGYQAGRILISYKEDKDKIIRWMIWGVLLLTMGLGLGLGGEDQGFIPINKNLWSISFIFLLSGMAFIILALFYFLVDIKKWWLGWPVIYVGRNSIAIYVSHEVFGSYFPFGFQNCGSHEMKLLENGLGVFCWLWVAWKMNQEKIFVKV